MKRIKLSQFIGRQLSRLKIGQTYYAMGMYSISTIGILKIAFPDISIWTFLYLVPLMFICAFFIGYIMDETDVITMDYNKSVEMTQRYLTVPDNKNNDFRMLQMETMVKCFKALQENKPIDQDIYEEKYDEFLKKWNPPGEK